MLTIKCARCGKKIIKYNKVGSGKVLKCFQSRITRWYVKDDPTELKCPGCGNKIGRLEESFYKMIQNEFTYTGRKTKE